MCKNLVIIEVITEEKASMVGRLTADMVCGLKTGTGICFGDSGGPATVDVEGQHTLVGVSSWILG